MKNEIENAILIFKEVRMAQYNGKNQFLIELAGKDISQPAFELIRKIKPSRLKKLMETGELGFLEKLFTQLNELVDETMEEGVRWYGRCWSYEKLVYLTEDWFLGDDHIGPEGEEKEWAISQFKKAKEPLRSVLLYGGELEPHYYYSEYFTTDILEEAIEFAGYMGLFE